MKTATNEWSQIVTRCQTLFESTRQSNFAAQAGLIPAYDAETVRRHFAEFAVG